MADTLILVLGDPEQGTQLSQGRHLTYGTVN